MIYLLVIAAACIGLTSVVGLFTIVEFYFGGRSKYQFTGHRNPPPPPVKFKTKGEDLVKVMDNANYKSRRIR